MSVRRLRFGGLALACCAIVLGLLSVAALAAPVGPVIEESSVSDVASASATLSAKINPEGTATSYVFEYAPVGGSFAPVPSGVGNLGEGGTGVVVSVHLQSGLLAHNVYQYRVVATNSVDTVTGETGLFTTQTAGGEGELPDERQWELVSPPNKRGASIIPPIQTGATMQASEDGNAFTYLTTSSVDADPEGSRSPEGAQIMAVRSAGGWSDRDIMPNNAAPFKVGVAIGTEYRFFSEDLSKAVVQYRSDTPLLEDEPSEGYENTTYLRHSGTCESTPQGCYQFVTRQHVVQEDHELEGATPDLAHIIFPGEFGLEEWSEGSSEPVSVLPDGTVEQADPGSSVSLGWAHNHGRHAISDDGTRVAWTDAKEHLWLRDTHLAETAQVDVGLSGASEFQAASSDGSEIFFINGESLNSQVVNADLYEFSAPRGPAPLHGTLTDLTADQNPGEAAAVEGTPAVSEEGSHAYFVAKGKLTSEPRPGCVAGLDSSELNEEEATHEGRCRPKEGADNLYVSEIDPADSSRHATKFIATLSPEDQNDWNQYHAGYSLMTSRVSPDGNYFVFMSETSPTGYDNRDIKSGAREEEVYLYNAPTGALTCVSCNPTGSRPSGLFVSDSLGANILVDDKSMWGERWLAGSVPGWTNYIQGEALYQPRYLSDDGRVFFDSPDDLVPQATNGLEDVYEFEPAGIGSCATASVTYDSLTDGCVNLISSGTSSKESIFLDASGMGAGGEEAEDVFFLTAAKLAPQDVDTSYDLYDAHVCSSARPCVAAPASPPPCSSGDGCKAAPTPQPAIFGSPASATFSGAGDVTASTPKALVKAKSLTRAQKLARSLAACRQKRGRGKRMACERLARKRYGARSAPKAAIRKAKG